MEKFFSAKGLNITEYLRHINLWLAHNTNIIPRRILVGEFSNTGSEDFKYSFELTLDYEIEEGREVRYSLSCQEVKSCLRLGLDHMKDAWIRENPKAKIVLCSYLHGFSKEAQQVENEYTALPNCNRLWVLFIHEKEFSDSDEMSVFDEGYVAPKEEIEPEAFEELPCEDVTEESQITDKAEIASESVIETFEPEMLTLPEQIEQPETSIQITDAEKLSQLPEAEVQEENSEFKSEETDALEEEITPLAITEETPGENKSAEEINNLPIENKQEEQKSEFGVYFCGYCGTKLSELQQRYCIFCGKDVIDKNKNIPTK